MAKKKHIVGYTTETLRGMRERGETASDWARSAAMTSEQIEASVAADADEADLEFDWDNASVEMPKPKAHLNMRIDQHVLDYFRATGRGYQTRINAVLRAFVEAQARRPR